MDIIRLSGIKKRYADGEGRWNEVLRSVDLQVNEGEFVAIKGPSGVGKTTLLQILGTLLLPDSGEYLLAGENMMTPGVDHSQVRNQKIGFVFQEHRLLPQLSVIDNVLLPILAFEESVSTTQHTYALEWLKRLGVDILADRLPQSLSGGEAQRVAVCRALVMNPILLLADEPTGQLDSENALQLAKLLAEVAHKEGKTVVMVTHSDEVSALADHIFQLKEGVLQ